MVKGEGEVEKTEGAVFREVLDLYLLNTDTDTDTDIGTALEEPLATRATTATASLTVMFQIGG